jgi:hypothetical protein
MIYWPTKGAAAAHDYGLDWSPTLAKLGDLTIASSEWATLYGDAAVAGDGVDPDGKGTAARVLGGTAGQPTIFRNTVTLSDGQIIYEDVMVEIS